MRDFLNQLKKKLSVEYFLDTILYVVNVVYCIEPVGIELFTLLTLIIERVAVAFFCRSLRAPCSS